LKSAGRLQEKEFKELSQQNCSADYEAAAQSKLFKSFYPQTTEQIYTFR
jgi:hypothetical protein